MSRNHPPRRPSKTGTVNTQGSKVKVLAQQRKLFDSPLQAPEGLKARLKERKAKTRSRNSKGLGNPFTATFAWFVAFADWIKLTLKGVDKLLLAVALALSAFGLVAVFSATARQAIGAESHNQWFFLQRQSVFMLLGWLGLLGFSRVPFRLYQAWAWPLAGVSVLLLVATQFMGVTANGSERWLSVFGLQFQPSEFAKVAAVFLVAGGLSPASPSWQSNATTKATYLLGHLAAVAMLMFLIYKQPNLSITIIIAVTTALMLFVGGLSRLWFVLGVPAALAGIAYVIAKTPYQMRRIVGWLDPWKSPRDEGYNLIQSYYAIGPGGLFGRGLGQSIQKLSYLPFQHTDFIFSVICEELGFVGASALIALFAGLGYCGYRLAWRCPNRFGQLLAFGLTSLVVLQAIVNMYVATGLFPVTGVTLPLISYGGTSVVMTLAVVGILLNISRHSSAQIAPLHRA
jgi:cell division protein FtsW